MNSGKLIYDSNFVDIMILVISGIFVIGYIFNLILLMKRKKELVIIFFLRLMALFIVLLLFIRPVYVYNTVEEELLDVPIIIDSSFSMGDSVEVNGKTVSKSQYFLEIVNKNLFENDELKSKMNFVLYDPLKKMFLDEPNVSDLYGIFNIQSTLSLINSEIVSYPKAIIVSDCEFSNINNPDELSSYIPIYFIFPTIKTNDINIESVRFNKQKKNISVSVNTANVEGFDLVCSLYIKDKLVNTIKTEILSEQTNFDIAIPKSFIGKHIATIEVSLPDKEYDNTLNNIDYVEIEIEKEKTIPKVHYYFNKPTFNTAFISRLISQIDELTLSKYYPKSNNRISGKANINKDDIIIIQDLSEKNITSLNSDTLKSIKKHISNKGKTILFELNEDALKLQAKLFPNIQLLKAISKNMKWQFEKQYSLKLTKEGLNETFLTFNNKRTAQEQWNKLSFFNEPSFIAEKGKDGITLATINDKPAIIKSKDGNIFLFLFSGLWKMDFVNMSYGINSTFLSSLLWDLLIKVSMPSFDPTIVKVNKQIVEFGEEIELIFNPQSVNRDLLRISNKDGDKKLPTAEENNNLITQFKATTIGKNSIYNDNVLIGELFVKYPKIEKSEPNMNFVENLAQKSGGSVISNFEDISSNFQKETRKIEKNHKINLTNNYLFFIIIMIMLSLEWFIRKKFLQ